eukprot:14212148-Alexandrium_andersonii.AAC.1
MDEKSTPPRPAKDGAGSSRGWRRPPGTGSMRCGARSRWLGVTGGLPVGPVGLACPATPSASPTAAPTAPSSAATAGR